MRILIIAGALCLALIAVAGCAEEGESGLSSSAGRESFDRELEREEELDRELEKEEREFEESEPEPEAEEAEPTDCDSSYEGACLDPYAYDYDCEGGSGDGPEYTGPVTVVGDDHYGLDSDNDG